MVYKFPKIGYLWFKRGLTKSSIPHFLIGTQTSGQNRITQQGWFQQNSATQMQTIIFGKYLPSCLKIAYASPPGELQMWYLAVDSRHSELILFIYIHIFCGKLNSFKSIVNCLHNIQKYIPYRLTVYYYFFI